MRLPSRIPPLPLKLPTSLGRRVREDLVGLDIQPGFVAAVQARVNGSVVAEKAAGLELPADVMRDGEVIDDDALAEALRELFGKSRLGKSVRVGVANQRTVLRTLELPPVTDRKELAAAVSFQAQDQVPMPLNNAVMDFHPLGIVDTPAGPRQRVVLVAAQRDMIERLIGAVRRAGLDVEGVDLSAFALIRSLYRREPEQTGRVLYLNVDGLTNLAIAEGTVCRFTRVVGSGFEGMAGELAERRSIALTEARALLAAVDLTAPAPEGKLLEPSGADRTSTVAQPGGDAELPEGERNISVTEAEDQEDALSYEELAAIESGPIATVPRSESDVWGVLENGIRDISGEVRNSLDFHRSQDGGGDVAHVVMSGRAQDIPGFAEALQASLGVEVRHEEIGMPEQELSEDVSPHRLAIATGLAIAETQQ